MELINREIRWDRANMKSSRRYLLEPRRRGSTSQSGGVVISFPCRRGMDDDSV
jgi:hypothetical protein